MSSLKESWGVAVRPWGRIRPHLKQCSLDLLIRNLRGQPVSTRCWHSRTHLFYHRAALRDVTSREDLGEVIHNVRFHLFPIRDPMPIIILQPSKRISSPPDHRFGMKKFVLSVATSSLPDGTAPVI